MRAEEAILEEIIKDGSVEVGEWPELLKHLLQRLDHIAYNSFLQPALPPTEIETLSTAPPHPTLSTESTLVSESSEPAETTLDLLSPPEPSHDCAIVNSSPKPMAPPPMIPSPASPQPAAEAPSETSPPVTLHPDDLSMLTSLTHILTTQFDAAPPYTIQRMAELLTAPTKHYRSLSKFLRALQRVLSVSSSVTAFPLPPSVVEATPNGSAFMLGSDESLGGALLSPIPWLTPTALTEDLENSDPMLTANGISQGELLRQEQELGIVPAVQIPASDELLTGPPPLGPEDVGPQPEGTVFADPPRSLEEARSPPAVTSPPAIGIDTAMGEDKVEEAAVEAGEEEKMDEKADEKKVEEEKKDDMEVDAKEKAKEQEDKMQLDAASDGKEEAAKKEVAT